MLKLEKCLHSQHVSVALRERDSFFSVLLLKALATALVLHLGAFLLFHIQPFKSDPFFLFSPVQVQTELKTSLVSSLVIDESPLQELSSPPPFIEMASPSLFLKAQPLKEEDVSFPVFDIPLTAPSLVPFIEKPAVRLFVSGELADYPLVSQDPRLENSVKIADFAKEPFYVSYHVRLDDQTGVLFWHERLQPSGSSEINNLTEQILLDAQFDTSSASFMPSGFLHFVVYPKEAYD